MDKRRIGVRGIIYRDGKVLAVKHNRKDGEAPFWCVPGGGLDPLEPMIDGVKREIMEELGVEAEVGRLILVQQLRTSRVGCDEELELMFMIDNPEDFEQIDLQSTSHGADEIARLEFVDPTKVNLLPNIIGTPEFMAKLKTNSGDVQIHNELDQPPL